MGKIHSLSILNFRGIREFNDEFDGDLVCIIGRGDSGKSTILEALSIILSGSWNISFFDNDFYNCDTTNPLIIEATLIDVPKELLVETKFGLYLKGYDPVKRKIYDDIEYATEAALTIQLRVEKDLEPQWNIVTNKEIGSKPISASDRSKFNSFLVSDYVDRHFSWGKGNPLYSLLKQDLQIKNDEEDVLIEILRDAKSKIDGSSFSKFDTVVNKVKVSAEGFGIDISKTVTTIDFRDIVIKDGKMSLHDGTIPFRLKGKGSKRLISMTIQALIAGAGGIVLIDEIEQGLEADRVQHLVNVLSKNNRGQVFIATHSRDVLVEVSVKNIYLIRKGMSRFVRFNESLQGLVRKNPESFFARRVIVAEGPTEVGFCKALNEFRVSRQNQNMAYLGIRIADGSGREMFNYVKAFHASGFPVCLICDSDSDGTENDKNIETEKEKIKEMGVPIIDWEKGDNLEAAVLKDIPFSGVKEIFELGISFIAEEMGSSLNTVKARIIQALKAKFPQFPDDFDNASDSAELRKAISLVATKQSWFKNQEKGRQLGKLVFKYFDVLPDSTLKKQILAMSKWIDT